MPDGSTRWVEELDDRKLAEHDARMLVAESRMMEAQTRATAVKGAGAGAKNLNIKPGDLLSRWLGSPEGELARTVMLDIKSNPAAMKLAREAVEAELLPVDDKRAKVIQAQDPKAYNEQFDERLAEYLFQAAVARIESMQAGAAGAPVGE